MSDWHHVLTVNALIIIMCCCSSLNCVYICMCIVCHILTTPYPLQVIDELNKRVYVMVDLRHLHWRHATLLIRDFHVTFARPQPHAPTLTTPYIALMWAVICSICSSQLVVGRIWVNVRLWAAQPLHTVQGVWVCLLRDQWSTIG